MKRFLLLCIGFIITCNNYYAKGMPCANCSTFRQGSTDSLPDVFEKNHADFIETRLRHEAVLKYEEHQLPNNLKEWESFRGHLKDLIIRKAGIIIDHKLPLNIKETGFIKMNGYTIKNISFQTRPGVYATANLYVPDGKGPFPAVVHMHGHWKNAKADEICVQQIGRASCRER